MILTLCLFLEIETRKYSQPTAAMYYDGILSAISNPEDATFFLETSRTWTNLLDSHGSFCIGTTTREEAVKFTTKCQVSSKYFTVGSSDFSI